MNFSTEDILRALREGATDADLATSFASALNEATKLYEEENAKAKAAEADRMAKEALYEDCANAFTNVLKAEGIDEFVSAKDIHDIVDSIKNAGTLLEKLADIFSTLDKEMPKAKVKRKHLSSDDDIIQSFLASL